MATLNENNQSCLEVRGIDARNTQQALSDYNAGNEYNERHKDALSDGDAQGKGTGNYGGPGWSIPDCTKPTGQYDYSNFNTWDGGNACDIKSRTVMTARSLYGPGKEYGKDIFPDTSLNVADGQYNGDNNPKIAYTCPVA